MNFIKKLFTRKPNETFTKKGGYVYIFSCPLCGGKKEESIKLTRDILCKGCGAVAHDYTPIIAQEIITYERVPFLYGNVDMPIKTEWEVKS